MRFAHWLIVSIAFSIGLSIGVASMVILGEADREESIGIDFFLPESPGNLIDPRTTGLPGEGSDSGEPVDPPDFIPDSAQSEAGSTAGAQQGGAPPDDGGVIRGTVRTENGAPLEGVVVHAFPVQKNPPKTESWRARGAPPPDESAGDEGARLSREAREKRESRRSATTTPDGCYAVARLGDTPYTLSAFKDGFRISMHGRSGTVRPGSTVDFVARRLSRLKIDVLLPGGERPERAQISASQAGTGRYVRGPAGSQFAWTRAEPDIWLERGCFTLKASIAAPVSGHNDFVSDPKDVALGPGLEVTTVVFELKAVRGVKGRVKTPPEFPLSAVYVYAWKAEPGNMPEGNNLPRNKKSSFANESGDFEFRFSDLEPGTWTIAAAMPNSNKVESAVTIEVAESMAEVELAVSAPDSSRMLTVTVTDPDGNTLWDCSLTLMRRGDVRDSAVRSSAVPGPDGSQVFIFEQFDPSRPSRTSNRPGNLYVLASSPAYGRAQADFPEGSNSVSVRFQEPAFLDVTVSGASLGEVTVSVVDRTNARGPESRGATVVNSKQPDKDGRLSLGPFAPGPHEVLLYTTHKQRPDGGHDSGAEVSKVPVTLSSGRNAAEIAVPVLYSLTVSFEKPDSEIWVSLNKGDENDDNGSTVAQGKITPESPFITFSRLPPGRYTIHGRSGSLSGIMRVVVPGQSSVNFVPLVFNAMRVSVKEASGPLASAGFRDSDLIVAIDGIEFRDEHQMQSLIYGSAARDSVKVTLVRGGKTVEMQVSPSAVFNEDEDPGGELNPDTR